jgi:hypothetical protein
MRDSVINDSAEEMLRRTSDQPQLIQTCTEYFEIAIGDRLPTGDEKGEACHLLLVAGLVGIDSEPIDKVKILKYPLTTHQRNLLLMLTRVEYEVFSMLASETSLVEAPHIPMLKYELLVQQGLFEDEEYELAALRQSTLIESFLRLKTGVGQVKWEWTVKCAYRGEEMFDEPTYEDLELLKEVRNDYAHDWEIYVDDTDRDRLRRACRAGLRVISRFHFDELTRTFKSYSSKHISQRYPTDWGARQSSMVTGSEASVSVKIICDHCGEKFNPIDHWKRCPECDARHSHWEE